MTPPNAIDRHHLNPEKRRRDGEKFARQYARIRLRRYKHTAWHKLFGVKTIDEIITHLEDWHKLFGDKPLTEAIAVMHRVREIKSRT